MKEKIYEMIQKYDSIIIARHKSPDFDAYGSQFGLYYALKEAYPEKEIYAVGDSNPLNYFQEMDNVSEDVYKKSLLIIIDTVASQMLEEKIYKNYDKLILIDHHRNEPDIKYDLYFQDVDASSSAEIITSMLLEWKVYITTEAARALYIGIIGDTGRFMYNNTTPKTFKMASVLLNKGIDIQDIHNTLYLEPKENKIIKNEFFKTVKYTKHNIAYRKNTLGFIKKYKLTSSYVSRGLVNQMAGMAEVPIWVNFTYDTDTKQILCELRSRKIPIIDIAKKYGGGGHLYAAGCSLNNWKETNNILNDLDEILEENNEI